MKNWTVSVLAGLAGTVAAIGPVSAGDEADSAPLGIASAREASVRTLARALLPVMPRAHRDAIVAAGGIGSEGYRSVGDDSGWILVSHDDRYEDLSGVVSPALFARMDEAHLAWMLNSRERAAEGHAPAKVCFAPGTDPDLIAAMDALFREEFWNGAQPGDRFTLGNRWTTTASSFSAGSVGDPITLTYSFAPDGALADNLFGANRANQLNSWLDGIYGSSATWQALFDSVFQRWGELIGVEYIHEENDDGVEANLFPGQLGVRGDVRIFAVPLDGNGNVLAYNQLPNAGDMVLDSSDSFYNNTGGQSIRLRNVVSHEHGHGLGFLHVCPINQTKLMEPTASTSFDGPQLDDTLAGQRYYGDPLEPNDESGEATDLGDLFVGASDSVVDVSIDDNSDVDYFRVNVTQAMEIVVDVAPDADAYFQGPQFGSSCPSGSFTDFNANQDLSIELLDSSLSQVEFVDDTSIGNPEQLRATLTTPGEYFIVVDDGGFNSIQKYRFDVAGEPVPFDGPTIEAQESLPGVVAPGTPVELDFEVLANQDVIVDGPDLLYRFDDGAYNRVAMTSLGGDQFRATIPAAACDDDPEYFIEVEGDTVGAVNLPAAGAADPFSYAVGELTVFLEEDFESPIGWNDSLSTASSGDWEVGVPVSSPGAPPSDFDGSGQAYLTENASGADVDGGKVFLRSPSLDLSDGGRFTYAYWLSGGGIPFNNDSMVVEYSTNGQITWTEARVYTSETDGWQTDTIEIDADTGVDNMYFRFVVEDGGADNIVEAALDAVSVGTVTCTDDPGGCNDADIAEPFGVLDLQDVNAFISAFSNQEPPADIAEPFGVWDLADIGAFTSEFTAGCP